MKGRLRQALDYWGKIGFNKTIRQVISEAYKIPFISTSKLLFLLNNKSALTNKIFVHQEITELINTRRVKEVENAPYIVNPFSLSKKRDKLCLIPDLKHINIVI